MPCYDERSSPTYVREECLREFMHNSPVAEMLCYLMKQIEAGSLTEWPAGLWEWWAEHKERDAKKVSP